MTGIGGPSLIQLQVFADGESLGGAGGINFVGVQATESGGLVTVNANNSVTNILGVEYGARVIDVLDDLPPPIGDAITLKTGLQYIFNAPIDLGTLRLVAEPNVHVSGRYNGTTIITSSYAGPVLQATGNILVDNLGLRSQGIGGIGFSAASGGTAAAILKDVNFYDCPRAASVSNMGNVLMIRCVPVNCGQGVLLGGTIASFVMESCAFSAPQPGFIMLDVPASVTITRRIRASQCAFTTPPGTTALSIDSALTCPPEAIQLLGCAFTGGGSYIAGISNTDNKSFWADNLGVENTVATGAYYEQDNATATNVPVANTFYKIAGTTIAQAESRFAAANNSLTYIGSKRRQFLACGILTVTGSANDQIGVKFVVNGNAAANPTDSTVTMNTAGRAENITVISMIDANPGDVIELWGTNKTANRSFTGVNYNVVLHEV